MDTGYIGPPRQTKGPKGNGGPPKGAEPPPTTPKPSNGLDPDVGAALKGLFRKDQRAQA